MTDYVDPTDELERMDEAADKFHSDVCDAMERIKQRLQDLLPERLGFQTDKCLERARIWLDHAFFSCSDDIGSILDVAHQLLKYDLIRLCFYPVKKDLLNRMHEEILQGQIVQAVYEELSKIAEF